MGSNTCICDNNKYFKSVVDSSVIECDKTIFVMDIISTNKTNTKATNVMRTASINCHNKKSKRLLYFAYSFACVYYCLLSLWKRRRYNIKWKIMNLKKFA